MKEGGRVGDYLSLPKLQHVNNGCVTHSIQAQVVLGDRRSGHILAGQHWWVVDCGRGRDDRQYNSQSGQGEVTSIRLLETVCGNLKQH